MSVSHEKRLRRSPESIGDARILATILSYMIAMDILHLTLPGEYLQGEPAHLPDPVAHSSPMLTIIVHAFRLLGSDSKPRRQKTIFLRP